MTEAERLVKSTKPIQYPYYENALLHRILQAEPVAKKIGYKQIFYEFADGSKLIEVNNTLSVQESIDVDA